VRGVLGNTASFDFDNLFNVVFLEIQKYHPELKRTAARDVLRYLLYRLWSNGHGKLINSTLQLAQGTIAKKFGLSRQWVFTLCQRLQKAGLIEYEAPYNVNKMQSSCIFRIGRQVKYLLVTLKRSRSPKKFVVNSGGQKRPSFQEEWENFLHPLEQKKRKMAEEERKLLDSGPDENTLNRKSWLKSFLDKGKTAGQKKEE
jgi:DNA-binding Lrp family transcriptional regulator